MRNVCDLLVLDDLLAGDIAARVRLEQYEPQCVDCV